MSLDHNTPEANHTNTLSNVRQVYQFAHNLIDAWNSHDPRCVAEYFADEYEGDDVGLSMPIYGKRGVRRYVAYTLLGLPDIHFKLDEAIAEVGLTAQKLVMVWTATGTHKGKTMNIPPSGRKVSYRGVTIFTVKNGKVTHSLRLWDIAGMIRQFGLLPELPEI
jgi:steroid delta-isomerase-like uncharacterized protein